MRTIAFAILLACLPAWGAREFVAASSTEGLTSLSLSETPATVACRVWVLSSSFSATQSPLIVSSSISDTPYFALQITGAGGGKLRAYHRGGTPVSQGYAESTNKVPTNQWVQLAGVFNTLTSRIAYVNEVASYTDTLNVVNFGTNNQVAVGSLRRIGYLQGFSGSIADAAIWNVALTADEIASLAAGASPLTVRPQSLVFYAPLTGESTTTEVNLIGLALSLSNSPARATSHPRIFNP